MTINDIDAFVFDFDGVLTNNLVYLNELGEESVCCSRSDGLAFDVLNKLNKPVFILSTEKNPVVEMRAKKIKVPLVQGVSDKLLALENLAKKNNFYLQSTLFVGNDLNDYFAMKACGYSACPSDSHKKIKNISKCILTSKGGSGVAREILEETLGLDFIKILYKN